MYREPFLGIDVFLTPRRRSNKSAIRVEPSEVNVLFTLVLIGAFQIINSDIFSQSLLQRLAFKDIKA